MPKAKLTEEQRNVIRSQNLAKAREAKLKLLKQKKDGLKSKKDDDKMVENEVQSYTIDVPEEGDYTYEYSYSDDEAEIVVQPKKKQQSRKEKAKQEPAPPEPQPTDEIKKSDLEELKSLIMGVVKPNKTSRKQAKSNKTVVNIVNPTAKERAKDNDLAKANFLKF